MAKASLKVYMHYIALKLSSNIIFFYIFDEVAGFLFHIDFYYFYLSFGFPFYSF